MVRVLAALLKVTGLGSALGCGFEDSACFNLLFC